MEKPASSIDHDEISHFAQDSLRWWDEDGPFRPLHRLNPLRIRYIRDQICRHTGRDPDALDSLTGLKILDIGCGGGLVSEALARMGALVTGVDADAQAIAVARDHAAAQNLPVDYQACAAENLLPRQAGAFDIVLALEIVEHVANTDSFLQSCVTLCRPGGLLILSTLNRTPRSFLLGIIAAEHILRWVPRGTHDWKKFIRPAELSSALRRQGAEPTDLTGYTWNSLTGLFDFTNREVTVNYLMTARKP